MSKLKIAIVACGFALTLATGAQAYELRIGNGSSSVTINASPEGSYATPNGRGGRSAIERPFAPANGAR